MKAPVSLFPSLAAEAALADVQLHQTLALGLVPLGIVVLLFAAVAPEWPSPVIWAGGAATLGGMGLLWIWWRRAGRCYQPGYSTAHFLVRYLFIVLCPVLLWIGFGRAIFDMAGMVLPCLLGVLLVLYPFGRILHERVGPDPRLAPRLTAAYMVCQQVEMILLVAAILILISRAALDARTDEPNDPTPLLLVLLWMLAVMGILAGVVLAVAKWHRLFGRCNLPERLDDPAPPVPAGPCLKFGSDRF